MSLPDLLFLVGLGLLGFTWLWAAETKVRDVRSFEVASRDLLPTAFARVVPLGARLIPLIEATLGILLLTHRALGITLGFSSGLLGLFTVLLIGARRRGTMTACACFGTARAGLISRVTIARSGLLWILSSTLCALEALGAEEMVHTTVAQIGYSALMGLLAVCTVGVASASVRLVTTVEQAVRSRHRPGGGTA